ncbi:NADH dehydrogenase [ubiquinone] 1 alpha subcomplex subunit 13 [Aphelenchoides bicaudatus]|nr:NADH dehydrogenase [ubiquinone] 1 alpha subcomplex subunit 13 [Aphelenchoides bicaudatus]
MSTKYRQDMPPEGGYRDFNWERTYSRRILKPVYVLPVFAGIMVYGYIQNKALKRMRMNRRFEDKDIYNALQPFLTAERDRSWLKHVSKNREYENEIMKDVPGWVTGTWYGEPVYFTLGEKWWDPTELEFFVHSEDHAFKREHLWRHHSEYSAPKFYDDWLPKWALKYIW